jgi:hypothetical protein
MDKLAEAVVIYLDRKYRAENPDGNFDNANRWYPSEAEKQPCCNSVRGPSRAHPFSYMVHCRTAKHVSALTGISESEIKKGARVIEAVKKVMDKMSHHGLDIEDITTILAESKTETGQAKYPGNQPSA